MLSKRRSGLGSLIPGAGLEAEGPQLAPITTIAVNPFQPRTVFAPAALEELAESIRRHGIIQPLTVRRREGGFELIAGERRLQAARKAGLTEVPVVVRECSDEESLALALVENIQREDLNAIEAARSYAQLQEQFGLTQGEIADHVGKSRSAVANTLRLLALPSAVQQSIEDGALSEGHARALLVVEQPEKQHAFYTRVIADGLSVRALESLINPTPKAKPRKTKQLAPDKDANLARVEADLQAALGTKVRFKAGSTGKKGVIEIEYYTPEDLERIYEVVR